jgi:hypothetical protein
VCVACFVPCDAGGRVVGIFRRRFSIRNLRLQICDGNFTTHVAAKKCDGELRAQLFIPPRVPKRHGSFFDLLARRRCDRFSQWRSPTIARKGQQNSISNALSNRSDRRRVGTRHGAVFPALTGSLEKNAVSYGEEVECPKPLAAGSSCHQAQDGGSPIPHPGFFECPRRVTACQAARASMLAACGHCDAIAPQNSYVAILVER